MNSNRKVKPFDAIENYINGVTNDFSELFALGSNNVILKYLKKYIDVHPERAYEINMMIDNLDILKYERYEHENLIDVLEYHLEQCNSNYIDLIFHLLILDEKQAINYLKERKISIDKLKKSIDKFSKLYKKQLEEINYIKDIMNEYELECAKVNTKKTNYVHVSLFYDPKDKYNINNAFECLYLSNLSIEEFCSLTGESISITKTSVKSSLKDSSKADKAKEILSRISSKEFYDKMISLAYEIDTNESFDALDYFEVTRLKNSDFRDIISKLIDKKDLIRIVKKVNTIVKYSTSFNGFIEIHSKTIVSGREITSIEKDMILDFLSKNYLPLGLYNVALRKYVSGNLKILKK